MKTLYILRHAEAAPGSPDEQRHLTDKGRTQAKQVGQAMREKGWHPATIFCSPATRTKQTWEGLDLSGPKPDFKKDIYNASTGRSAGDRAGGGEGRVADGGRPQPGHSRAGGGAGGQRLEQAGAVGGHDHFQPGTLAVYQFAGEWSDVQPDGGLLQDLIIPPG